MGTASRSIGPSASGADAGDEAHEDASVAALAEADLIVGLKHVPRRLLRNGRFDREPLRGPPRVRSLERVPEATADNSIDLVGGRTCRKLRRDPSEHARRAATGPGWRIVSAASRAVAHRRWRRRSLCRRRALGRTCRRTSRHRGHPAARPPPAPLQRRDARDEEHSDGRGLLRGVDGGEFEDDDRGRLDDADRAARRGGCPRPTPQGTIRRGFELGLVSPSSRAGHDVHDRRPACIELVEEGLPAAGSRSRMSSTQRSAKRRSSTAALPASRREP